MMLISFGDSIIDGVYTEHSRFEQVVNYVNNDHLLSVVLAAIGAGPINIVVDQLPGIDGQVVIKGKHVCINTQEYDVPNENLYRSLLDDTDWHTDILQRNIACFLQVLKDDAPDLSLVFLLDEARLRHFKPGFNQKLAEELSVGVSELFAGEISSGVSKLRGCGLGLTPSGDDFLAGVLLALNALELGLNEDYSAVMETIYCVARQANPLSNALLMMARNGRFYCDQKKLIEALFSQSEDAVIRAVVAALNHGETSGADTCTGIYLTLHSAIFNRHPPFSAGGHV